MCVCVCVCVCVFFFSFLISILYVNVRNALIKKYLKKKNRSGIFAARLIFLKPLFTKIENQ